MTGCSSSSSTPSNKGKEIVVEEQLHLQEDVPSLPLVVVVEEDEEEEDNDKEGGDPEWLDVLMRTDFWEPCTEHAALNRSEKCMFCLHCYNVSCPHCTHDEPGHRLLKIRRYVYRSVVLASDMQALKINVSRVQPYVINGQNVVYLRPMNRSKQFRPQAGTPRCTTCHCWLRNAPHLFCSVTCARKAGVSQDDFSGPEAEVRYRSHQINKAERPPAAAVVEPLETQQGHQHVPLPEAEEHQHAPLPEVEEPQHALLPDVVEEHAGNEAHQDVILLPDEEAEHGIAEPPPPPPPPPANANQNNNFRRRRRKQVLPARAPFF